MHRFFAILLAFMALVWLVPGQAQVQAQPMHVTIHPDRRLPQVVIAVSYTEPQQPIAVPARLRRLGVVSQWQYQGTTSIWLLTLPSAQLSPALQWLHQQRPTPSSSALPSDPQAASFAYLRRLLGAAPANPTLRQTTRRWASWHNPGGHRRWLVYGWRVPEHNASEAAALQHVAALLPLVVPGVVAVERPWNSRPGVFGLLLQLPSSDAVAERVAELDRVLLRLMLHGPKVVEWKAAQEAVRLQPLQIQSDPLRLATHLSLQALHGKTTLGSADVPALQRVIKRWLQPEQAGAVEILPPKRVPE